LTVWEKKRKDIKDIPIVDRYKYLGIVLNKQYSASNHLQALKDKIDKYEKMMRILSA
jgi:hypothetical protein